MNYRRLIAVRRVLEFLKKRVKQSIEKERALERHIEAFSRFLWPWSEKWLIAVVSLLVLLDYVSTYAVLRLSGKRHIYEAGLLARWSLRTGGFTRLLLIDIASVIVLSLTAVTVRFLYRKFGFAGFGRTGFVMMLAPYVVMTMVAIINNVALTLL